MSPDVFKVCQDVLNLGALWWVFYGDLKGIVVSTRPQKTSILFGESQDTKCSFPSPFSFGTKEKFQICILLPLLEEKWREKWHRQKLET